MTASRLFPAFILPDDPAEAARYELQLAGEIMRNRQREVDDCDAEGLPVPDYLEAQWWEAGRKWKLACRAVAALRNPMQHAAE